MLPKITLTTATASGLVGNISIANIDSQIVIMGQLYNQLTNNDVALNNKINSIKISNVKMPLIKKFSGEKVKLKRFLI
jgi:hypothetical protein